MRREDADPIPSTVDPAEAIARALGLPLVHPALVQPTAELVSVVSEELARRHRLLPVLLSESARGTTLWVAMEDPRDVPALDACAAYSGVRVRPMVASAEELRGSIHRWYGGPPPKPAAPPTRRATSVLELDVADLTVDEPAKAPRSPVVLVVQAPPPLATACREVFVAEAVDVRETDLLDASRVVRASSPFAIVVPDDVYQFDPSAFSTLAIGARALLVTAADAAAPHLPPLLRTAHRSFFA